MGCGSISRSYPRVGYDLGGSHQLLPRLFRFRLTCHTAGMENRPFCGPNLTSGSQANHSPNLAAAFSRNSDPFRMYRRTMFTERWPV